MLAVEVLQRDHAGAAVADDQRDEHGRLRRLPGDHCHGWPGLDGDPLRVFVHDDGFTGLERSESQADQLHRLIREPDPPFDRVGEMK